MEQNLGEEICHCSICGAECTSNFRAFTSPPIDFCVVCNKMCFEPIKTFLNPNFEGKNKVLLINNGFVDIIKMQKMEILENRYPNYTFEQLNMNTYLFCSNQGFDENKPLNVFFKKKRYGPALLITK